MGLDWCTRRVQFVFSFTTINFICTERGIISKEGGNVVEIWEKEDSTCLEFYINNADTEHPWLDCSSSFISNYRDRLFVKSSNKFIQCKIFLFFFFVHKILSFDLHEEFNILLKRSLRRSFVERCKYYWRK